jgi:nucleoside phosphorylase
MGMTSAAVLTMKMIYAFRPRYVAMCGIAAGFPGKCSLGDIVAVDPGWDYGSGKWKLQGKTPVFLPAPHQIGLDSFIRGKLSLMAQDGGILDEIRRRWSAAEIPTALRMHLGPVASGAAVIAEPGVSELIKRQHRDAFGLEMETYGVFAACEDCSLPQPKAFSLKSICDFANARKADSYQSYAAFTSAAALQVFVERFL